MNLFGAFTAVLAIIIPLAAQASTDSGGQITSYTAQTGGVLFFTSDAPRTPQPGCSTTNRWVVDGNAPGGQVLVASILTAFAQHKIVGVTGSGSCNVWGDTETVSYLTVNQ